MRTALIAMLLFIGCADPREQDLKPPTAPAEHPRYWLQRPSDAVPRLVELADDYIVDPDEPSWRVRWSWPERPEDGQGLMLYAQRTVRLRRQADGEPGPVTLYPGALVAVVPIDGGYLVAPGTPARGSTWFAEEDAMGIAPVAPAVETEPSNRARASHCWYPGLDDWLPETCVPVLLGPGENEVTQRVGLVETRGELYDFFATCRREPLVPVMFGCLASVVSRSSTGFRIGDQAIDTVPDGYRDIAAGETELARWLHESEGTIHVMVWQNEAIHCAPITFKAHASDNGVEGHIHEPRYDRHLPFRYRASTRDHVATLAVQDTIHGCGRADVMFVAGSVPGEVHVLRGPVVGDARFYLETEAERWFATKSDCEAAASKAGQQLDADQRQMLSLGLHSPFDYRWTLGASHDE